MNILEHLNVMWTTDPYLTGDLRGHLLYFYPQIVFQLNK